MSLSLSTKVTCSARGVSSWSRLSNCLFPSSTIPSSSSRSSLAALNFCAILLTFHGFSCKWLEYCSQHLAFSSSMLSRSAAMWNISLPTLSFSASSSNLRASENKAQKINCNIQPQYPKFSLLPLPKPVSAPPPTFCSPDNQLSTKATLWCHQKSKFNVSTDTLGKLCTLWYTLV